jgi:coproporphyrinogen III oxidase-like Fe-S oxidoreductase
LPAYLEALECGAVPAREVEELGADVRRVERLMLGLRLDEPLRLESVADAVDPSAVARLEQLGLLTRPEGHALALTKRGRLLGGGVTAELLAVN